MTRRDRIWKAKNATELSEDQVTQSLQQILTFCDSTAWLGL